MANNWLSGFLAGETPPHLALMQLFIGAESETAAKRALANFNDFDTLYGHRRDVPGYAKALEEFDSGLPRLMSQLRHGDLVIVTADHGCDPTWRGTDHTREFVPIIGFGPDVPRGNGGIRKSFADAGATIAAHLSLPVSAGTPLWN